MELKKSLFGYNVQDVTDFLKTQEQEYVVKLNEKDQIIEAKEQKITELLEKISVMEQQQGEMLDAFKAANEKIKTIEEKAQSDAGRIVLEAEMKQKEMYELLSDFRESLMNVENIALDTVERFLYGIKELERSVPSKDKITGNGETAEDTESRYKDAKHLMHAIYEISGRKLAVSEEQTD